MLRLIFSTFSSEEAAAVVVRQLVEEKLAACGTILPGARSIYRWQGQIEDTPEAMVIFKTVDSKQAVLANRLRELHPYDTPEILSLDPGNVSAKYSAWVAEALGERPTGATFPQRGNATD